MHLSLVFFVDYEQVNISWVFPSSLSFFKDQYRTTLLYRQNAQGVFHVFWIVQMVPNRAKHDNMDKSLRYETLTHSRPDPREN